MIKLDNLQLKILQALWQLDEASVNDIQVHLKKERTFAPTTIGTILTRLCKKNLVTYRKEGREYIYRAIVDEKETKLEIVSNLVEKVFQGNPIQIVNYLLQDKKFNNVELEELRSLIKEQSQNK